MRPHHRALAVTLCLVLPFCACRSANAIVEDQTKQFRSLRATTEAVAKAWLEQRVSSAFARVALDQTFQLVEQARTELTGSTTLAADPRAAALAEACGRLSRAVASLAAAIDREDRDAASGAASSLPSGPS